MKNWSFCVLFVLFSLQFFNSKHAVAVFHGMGGSCSDTMMKEFIKIIKRHVKGPVKCIQLTPTPLDSIFFDFNLQAKTACDKISSDNNFDDQISIIGLSMGGIYARSVVEQCDKITGQIVNYISLSSPQLGLTTIPKEFGPDNPILSEFYRSMSKQDAREQLELKFEIFNVLINTLNNNYTGIINKTYKSNFSKLKRVLLIRNKEDQIVDEYTSWFGFKMKKKKIIPPTSLLYTSDLIGLKHLHKHRRISLKEWEGEHVDFTQDEIVRDIIPILKGY
jgi:palmitoyl-protein thioesterase